MRCNEFRKILSLLSLATESTNLIGRESLVRCDGIGRELEKDFSHATASEHLREGVVVVGVRFA